MNIEQARFNMIEQQIRPWEVLDQKVLDLLFVVKREDFAPPAYRNLAFADWKFRSVAVRLCWPPRLKRNNFRN
jgi:protein-L-isoaspartate(D-aspartate) O-methyltransferase